MLKTWGPYGLVGGGGAGSVSDNGLYFLLSLLKVTSYEWYTFLIQGIQILYMWLWSPS